MLIRDGAWHALGDPPSRLSLLGSTLANPLLTFGDKRRTLRLRRFCRRRSLHHIFSGRIRGADLTIEEALRQRGFSEQGFIDNFARPFYGGIVLDRQLTTSARMLYFITKMLASGAMVIPERGMGEISAQLAARASRASAAAANARQSVIEAERRAVGVTLTGGEELQGDAVVIATDALTATRLTNLAAPDEPMGVTCVYFAGTTSLYSGPKLLLNANPIGFVNHAVQISNVSPAYAPKGQHLLSASVLTAAPMDEADLVARCRMDLSSWFSEKAFATYRPVGTYRIPFAQFRQPPGIFKQAPANITPTAGLFLAGEYTESSSIQGAMLSGERAAAAVLDALRAEEK